MPTKNPQPEVEGHNQGASTSTAFDMVFTASGEFAILNLQDFRESLLG